MASQSFAPPDLREPRVKMTPIGLKLPHDLIERIDRQAAKIRTTRAGLCRAFVLRGLEQLEQAPTASDLEDAKACRTFASTVVDFKRRHGLPRDERLSEAAPLLLQEI
jgi:hypothetical protein